MAKISKKSKFNQEDADLIYECLAEGKSLLSICEAMGIPYSTARRWEMENPEHAANSTRARELGCHYMAEECLRIADTPLEGVETTIDDKGKSEKRGDMLGHRKLQIETRMRLIGKWAPKIYGEKLALGGADDLPPLRALPEEVLDAKIAELMAKANALKS